MGTAPNPNRPHSRHRGQFGKADVVMLPAEGCQDPAPPLPPVKEWNEYEQQLWEELWGSPQAAQWDDSAITSVASYVVYFTAIMSGTASAWVASEMRHISDRLGLTPQSLASLGWYIPGGDE